jgi:chromatin segregation and condensation protein Rec8/ScpA/Scc1 (kleisin family)
MACGALSFAEQSVFLSETTAWIEAFKKRDADAISRHLSDCCASWISCLNHLDWEDNAVILSVLAEMVYCKSLALLPVVEKPAEDPDDLNAAENIICLSAYEKDEWAVRYRWAAEQLSNRTWWQRDVFPCGQTHGASLEQKGARYGRQTGYHLVKTFHRLSQPAVKKKPYAITLHLPSLRTTITRVVEQLSQHAQCDLHALLNPEPLRLEVVVIFVALLELAKVQLVLLNNPDTASSSLQITVRFHTAAEALAQIDASQTSGIGAIV